MMVRCHIHDEEMTIASRHNAIVVERQNLFICNSDEMFPVKQTRKLCELRNIKLWPALNIDANLQMPLCQIYFINKSFREFESKHKRNATWIFL